MEKILVAEALQFLELLRYPTVEIPAGRMTFLRGESGSGKSTLLRLLNATILPTAGQIWFHGRNIRTLDPIAYRRQVLLVPQEVFLLDGTVRENFQWYHEMRQTPAPTEAEMTAALERCCLPISLESRCATLSGGERQRVFLSIFLTFSPEVLLLDEPTAALDEATAMQLLENLKTYCAHRDITAVVVCHSNRQAERFADQTIWLEREAIS
jgi:putative ABC transport system ATP-binding protein